MIAHMIPNMMTLDKDAPFITPKTLMNILSQAQGYSRGLPYDLQGLFETQRTNWQAMVAAQESMIGSMKSMATQQSHIMNTLWQNHTAFLNFLLDEGTPEDKIARHAEISKTHYHTLVQDIRALQDTMSGALREAADILHHRALSTLSENQRQAQARKALLTPAPTAVSTKHKAAA